MNTRISTLALAALTLVTTGAFALVSGKVVAPAAALRRLQEGNKHFVSTKVSGQKPTAAKRHETAKEQHPFAVIVGCADSRTSPEILFDQNIGDLFVIRTAGELVDNYALGSIEYAVEHLGARLIIVMGHESCGAVKAALSSDSASGHIKNLVHDIQPAVALAKTQSGDLMRNAVIDNAQLIAEKICHEANFGEHAKKVKVMTAYYHLDSGKVEWPKEN